MAGRSETLKIAQREQEQDIVEAAAIRSIEPSFDKADQERQRRVLIEKIAYLKAEQRGFEPGHELEDWLAAEQEVKAQWGEDT